MQDIQEGTLRMHRKVTSGDVKDYASHVPVDEVELDKEEDIVYTKGVLTHASGTVTAKLMQKVWKNICTLSFLKCMYRTCFYPIIGLGAYDVILCHTENLSFNIIIRKKMECTIMECTIMIIVSFAEE